MLRSGGGQHTVEAGAWSGQVASEVAGHIMEKWDTEDVTLEGLSLEPHVVRRKRSLVSVLKRRLVRSLNEVEVCRYQDEEEEVVDTESGRRLNQCEYSRYTHCQVPDQNSVRCKQKRRASIHFCSTKDIKNLYCRDNFPLPYNPLFMSFASVNQTHLFSKLKYNTLV